MPDADTNANANVNAPKPDDTNPSVAEAGEDTALAIERLQLKERTLSGANWFFWIAGLSIINSIIVLAKGQWSFLAGLGITQVIDALAAQLSEEVGSGVTFFAMALNLTILGAFIVFGLQARKQQNWAFITGMVLYALDGLLVVLLVQDLLSIGFHIFALYFLFQGWRASNSLIELERVTVPVPVKSP